MTCDTTATRAVLDLVTGAWRTQAVHTAVRLRLPDLIADGHRDSAALAVVTGVAEDRVRRLLRLLVALGVFDPEGEGADRVHRPTRVSELLRDRPGSLRDMCLLYGEEFYQAWGQAESAVTTGTSGFEQTYGRPLDEHLAAHPEVADRFQRVMRSGRLVFDSVPTALHLTGVRTVVDLGGGSGQLLATVLAAAPDARGVLVDLPHTMPLARAYLAERVGLDRVDLLGQDMLTGPVPPGADVYLLSRVLAGHDTEACVRLLRRVRAVMTPRSRVVVLDRVATDDPADVLTPLWDLHLLVVNGGRERTDADCRALFDRSGLAVERVVELPLGHKGQLLTPVGKEPAGSAAER
ncbi:methyltransferase [Streptomyces sp. NPDC088789]|uniref:methyltransferase n=1 Tax=Streptomyces sp. NPDC088789 TaxID=3365899 RepID=UPI00382195E3